MRRVTRTAIALQLLFCPVSWAGEPLLLLEGESALIYSTTSVYVSIYDQVVDGCFTNVQSIKTAVELTLRRNDLVVLDTSSIMSDTFVISVIGYANSTRGGTRTGCTVYAEAYLLTWRPVGIAHSNGEKTFYPVEIGFGGHLLTGSELQNDRIKRFAVDAAESFVNKILASRQKVFEKYPNLKSFFENKE